MENNNRSRKVGAYIRVSTEKQAKEMEGSLTSQKQRLEAEIARRNAGYAANNSSGSKKWGELVRVYVEEGRSGKDTNRPEYQKMLADVQAGAINTVMVTELSRLSRSVSDFLKFMELLNANQADFICPQYDFDTTSPAGRVFVIILIALSQFERELTGERTRNNFYARALRGLCNGGSPILGYDRDPDNKAKRVVNEAEATIVRRIFQTFLDTGSIRATVDAVNVAGYRTKQYRTGGGEIRGGQLFVPNSVYGILNNLTYLGKREVNKRHKGADAEMLRDSERYQIVDASWPAIVDPLIFEKVRGKLDANRDEVKFDQWKTYPFVFSGRVTCMECGGEYRQTSAHGRNQKYSYYQHLKECPAQIKMRKNVPADDFEKVILRRLRLLASTPELLEEITKDQHHTVTNQLPALEAERLAAECEFRKTQEKIGTLMDRIASLPKDMDASMLIQHARDLETRKRDISDNIVRLNADIAVAANQRVNPEEVRKVIRFVNENMDKLPPPLKRDLIRRLIVGVKFGKDEMEVALNPSALVAEIAENRAQKQNGRTRDNACFALSPVRPLFKLG